MCFIMITIGIDIGKFNHCACIYDADTGEIKEPFFFKNNKEGFSQLVDSVQSFKSASLRFGLEDTGHYSDNLVFFLLNQDFTVALINPVTTDFNRKSKLKSSKNVKQDSMLIAKILLDDECYRLVTKETYQLRQLKQLTRHHHDLKEELNVYKNRLQKNINLVFPEFNTLFKTKYSCTYMNILKQYGSASVIANTDVRSLRKILQHHGRGLKVSLTAEHLKQTALDSIGEDNSTAEIEIKHLIAMIELLNTQIKEVDIKIEEFSHQLNSPITSIPGISHFSGMAILSEYGDMNCFSSAAKLISFAGVNPYEYQSGTYKAPQTALTKKGSKYLRKTLYQIALPLIKYNPVFRSYYNLKRSQGKSNRCSMGQVVRKLLRVIHHLVSTNINFDASLLN